MAAAYDPHTQEAETDDPRNTFAKQTNQNGLALGLVRDSISINNVSVIKEDI